MNDIRTVFSIVDKINVDKLYREIDNYIAKTGDCNPYIFMNEDTIKEVASSMPFSKIPPFTKSELKQNCMIGYWQGNKLFIDNSLKYGIVELR